ncbi:MAG: TRAP transporter fused permease subunit, partial [Gammaproteobacteria bacterium]|nr:TRAP transporter fused permease subunit [Gammaproteobacteria bacterium]
MSTTRYRALPGHWRTAVSIVAFGAVALCAARTFNVDIVSAEYLAGTHFFYLIAALLLPLVFILFPSSKAAVAVTLVDLTLATATGAVLLFCVLRANDIYEEGWEFAAPAYGIAVAMLAWVLLLEIGRRCGGWPVFWVAFCLSLYPLVAAVLPTVVDGLSYDFFTTVAFHLYSAESFQGVPLRAFVDWAVGYLVLGAVLQVTGGGDFFLNLTFALLGKTRGGPAKVSILASGLMGSMSGSVVSNVLTTGALTVPTMRRAGFSRTYAAGIEACASTGGVLMPPIMGAAAFVMARYLGVPYADVAIAALIPSVLYFYGLYIQVDAYAARYELTAGVSDSVPGVTDTLLKGWDYVCTFALLIWLLLGLHWHQEAPYLAAVLLLLLRARFGLAKLSRHAVERFGLEIGTQLAELLGILAP